MLVRGFDDEFYAPHSRHTTVKRKTLKKSQLKILAESDEAGIISGNENSGQVLSPALEYDPLTLKDGI